VDYRQCLSYELFYLYVDPSEVEISQIHVAVRQYVYCENILPFAKANLEKRRG